MFNNQGYSKQNFRASLAVVRVAESALTAITYLFLGLYTPGSLALLPSIIPAVLIGVPPGTVLIRKIDAETFRRICMSFDAWIVGFGLSRLLSQMQRAPAPAAYLVLLTIVFIDLVLLYRFFAQRARGTLSHHAVVRVAGQTLR